VSVDDHLLDAQYAPVEGTDKFRAQLRAANDNIDLIQVFLGFAVAS
jgi:hypothetical protein